MGIKDFFIKISACIFLIVILVSLGSVLLDYQPIKREVVKVEQK